MIYLVNMPKRCDLTNHAIFMPDTSGIWRCIQSTTDFVINNEILAHVCEKYNIDFPDGTVFARVKRYASGRCLQIEYRAYDALRVIITFNTFKVL